MYTTTVYARQAVRELTGLVEGANALLSGSKGLETKYLSLPSYASQRLSLALEADPNAVRACDGRTCNDRLHGKCMQDFGLSAELVQTMASSRTSRKEEKLITATTTVKSIKRCCVCRPAVDVGANTGCGAPFRRRHTPLVPVNPQQESRQ